MSSRGSQNYGTAAARLSSGDNITSLRKGSTSGSFAFPRSSFTHFGSSGGAREKFKGAAKEIARRLREEQLEALRKKSVFEQVWELIVGGEDGYKLLNLLFVFMFASPLAVYAESPAMSFTFGFFSLIPLAAVLGELTEDLSLSLGPTLGAMLNVTFGNATELIICIVAIQHSMFDIIKASMLGSILGNMLLVLGSAFVAAGCGGKGFGYNRHAQPIYSSLLLKAGFSLSIPTCLAHLPSAKKGTQMVPFYQGEGNEYIVLKVSRWVSIVCVITYFIFQYYSFTHKEHFEALSRDEEMGLMKKAKAGAPEDEEEYEEVEEEEEEKQLYSTTFGVVMLALVTIVISLESEVVVNNLENFAVKSGISKPFIAVILLPIVGNVCEHASAIMMAYKRKMDIAINIAVGSSIQIAVLVIPALVLISWYVNGENPPFLPNGQPGALDLNFHPFCAMIMLLSVLVVNAVINTEEGQWITGLFLLLTYTVCSISVTLNPPTPHR